MEKMAERLQTVFLGQITGKREQRNTVGTWVTLAAGEVQEASEMQSVAT